MIVLCLKGQGKKEQFVKLQILVEVVEGIIIIMEVGVFLVLACLVVGFSIMVIMEIMLTMVIVEVDVVEVLMEVVEVEEEEGEGLLTQENKTKA